MVSIMPRRLAALAAIAALLLVSGCIFDADEKENEPKKPASDFKPLTDKENVIHNLVECYKFTNIDRYVELLHPEYIWYNQQEDVQGGKDPFYTRDDDIRITMYMFLAKNNSHPDPAKAIDILELTIYSAPWQQVVEIGGNPCEDCWETTREYKIRLVKDGGNNTILGDDLIRFTIVPMQRDGQKIYVIYRADDIRKPQP